MGPHGAQCGVLYSATANTLVDAQTVPLTYRRHIGKIVKLKGSKHAKVSVNRKPTHTKENSTGEPSGLYNSAYMLWLLPEGKWTNALCSNS